MYLVLCTSVCLCVCMHRLYVCIYGQSGSLSVGAALCKMAHIKPRILDICIIE